MEGANRNARTNQVGAFAVEDCGARLMVLVQTQPAAFGFNLNPAAEMEIDKRARPIDAVGTVRRGDSVVIGLGEGAECAGRKMKGA